MPIGSEARMTKVTAGPSVPGALDSHGSARWQGVATDDGRSTNPPKASMSVRRRPFTTSSRMSPPSSLQPGDRGVAQVELVERRGQENASHLLLVLRVT